MKAGALRHSVTVQRLTGSAQTPEGEPDLTWTDYWSGNASIDPLLGREYFAADQVQSETDTKIGLRYEAGGNDEITAAMRVVFGSVVFNIVSPVNVRMMNREWVLYCKTGANLG